MTVLIIVFTLLLIGVVTFRIAAGFYVDKIPFFAALAPALTWICVIVAVSWAVFIGIKIYNEVKRK